MYAEILARQTFWRREARHTMATAFPAGVLLPVVDTAAGRFAPRGAAALGRLLEQLAADQHAADFAGAGADLVELGVAEQPPGRIFVDIAVAAEELDRVERALRRLLRGIEDRAGGVLARGLAAVAGLRHRID